MWLLSHNNCRIMKQTRQIPGYDPRSFRCCLCLHVKTGTLFYGIFMALGCIAFLGLLIFAAIHPDILMPQTQQRYNGIVLVQTDNESFLQPFGYEPIKQQFNNDNLCLMFGVTLVCLISTLALIYGAAKNVASYLMPFFCLQVFDFCLSCLVVVGCLTYAPNVKHYIQDQHLDKYPGMDYVMSVDSDYLMFAVIAILIFILSVKAYLICMVWSCYKYIQIVVSTYSLGRENTVDPDSEMLLPPCYEDAMKVPSNYASPPPYTME